MKKYFVLQLLFLLLHSSCVAQEKEMSRKAKLIEAPNDWSKESFSLPPSFASSIEFTGVEEVRFAPGWAVESSSEFWTYTFAWYLNGNAQLTEKRLKELMEDYFNGLTATVGANDGIASESMTKTNASFTSIKKVKSQQFYEGTIELYDVFFALKPIKLNVKVKEIYCPDVDKHLIVFSFSPKEFDHKVWEIFKNVSSPENCKQLENTFENSFTSHKTADYELIIPKGKEKGVLILFPGFPENPDIIKREFKIIEPAVENGIVTIMMTFNQRIWLEDHEKKKLSGIITEIFEKHNLEKENVFIGGFSSGGNISLLIGNYLKQLGNEIQPTGIFVIDSPVDLLGLYENTKRNIDRRFSAVSVQESQMLLNMLESNFGRPESGIAKYEENSVYTKRTKNTDNLADLKDVKIRLYTEPDTLWWRENRLNEYEEMNAYFLKSLSDELVKKYSSNKVEYIATENKGYRSSGERHPHSWSIVDVDSLIKWIMDE